MQKKNNENKNTGYTIIETMIAVSLFIIIIMMGMNALLNANVLHKKSQNMRSIMDNLSFVMEDIGKNMRTGTNYHCIDDNTTSGPSLINAHSCANGGAIAFKNSFDGSTWVYKIEMPSGGTSYNIYKSTDGGTIWVQLNPPEVLINSISGFSVLGAEPPSTGDKQQPFVTIRLVGKIITQNVVTPFSLQTSVSQRVIDI